MKYYLIAGEASGDLHGGNLIKELIQLDHGADIRCWGGDLMQQSGGTLVKHYRELAFMGFAEVLQNLKTILRNIRYCKEDIRKFNPDVVVLIDYPGFNLRIAEWAKKEGFKIIFYISPQVWAWKAGRVKKMRQFIDKMLVILPFEKKYFADKWNWDVEYVGHPLLHVVENFKPTAPPFSNKPVIALLPGSRKQELQTKLPIMLEVSRHFPAFDFIIAKAPGLEDEFYQPFIQPYNNVLTVRNQTYDLLKQATAALVTSGTATLETALFGVPEVVCYKGSPVSYHIARRLVKIKYISLVNLIMDKEVVKELIQNDLTVSNVVKELELLLNDHSKKEQLKKDYKELKEMLRSDVEASAKAANEVYELTRKINK
ncbi:MAG: lipid-A-disaccharide synthase [Chitinophagaceae bacterium]|nr:lipid-A-disaccharide synthase [Chitinophagaceae bacterium]